MKATITGEDGICYCTKTSIAGEEVVCHCTQTGHSCHGVMGPGRKVGFVEMYVRWRSSTERMGEMQGQGMKQGLYALQGELPVLIRHKWVKHHSTWH
jgi:hypothetical protein